MPRRSISAAVLAIFALAACFGTPGAAAKEKSPKKLFKELKRDFSRAKTYEEQAEIFNKIVLIDREEVDDVVDFVVDVAVAVGVIPPDLRHLAMDKFLEFNEGVLDDKKLMAVTFWMALNSQSMTEREFYQKKLKFEPRKDLDKDIESLADYLVGKTSGSSGSVGAMGARTSRYLSYYRRFTAAESLAHIRRKDTYDILKQHLEHPDPRTRCAAARGIGLVRYEEGLKALETAYYKEKDSDARIEIIVAIGRLSFKPCLASLERMLTRANKKLEKTFILEATEIVGKNIGKKGKWVVGEDGYAHYEKVDDPDLVDFEFGTEYFFIVDTTLSMGGAKEDVIDDILLKIERFGPKDRAAVLFYRDEGNDYSFREKVLTYNRLDVWDYILRQLICKGSNRNNSLLNKAILLAGLMPSNESANKVIYAYGDTPPVNYLLVLEEIAYMRKHDKFTVNMINASSAISGGTAIKHYREMADVGGGSYRDREDIRRPVPDEVDEDELVRWRDKERKKRREQLEEEDSE